jgi:hypothetical protein
VGPHLRRERMRASRESGQCAPVDLSRRAIHPGSTHSATARFQPLTGLRRSLQDGSGAHQTIFPSLTFVAPIRRLTHLFGIFVPRAHYDTSQHLPNLLHLHRIHPHRCASSYRHRFPINITVSSNPRLSLFACSLSVQLLHRTSYQLFHTISRLLTKQ